MLFQLTLPQIIAIIGLFLVLLELFVGVETGFDLLIIGLILFLSGLLAPSLFTTLLLVIVLSIVYIIFGRKIIKTKFFKSNSTSLNTDRLIGTKGVVIKHISANKPGMIQLEDEKWRAKASLEIKPGAKIVVRDIEGISLVVELLKKGD